MNFCNHHSFYSRYILEKGVTTSGYDPITRRMRITANFDPKPEQMPLRELVEYWDWLELVYILLVASRPEDQGDQIRIWQEELRYREKLRHQAMDEMLKRIRAIRDKNCVADWANYVGACPSMGLTKPEDFILYWYIHGEFPYDMDVCDIKNVRRELQDMLDELYDSEARDEFWRAQRDSRRIQLEELKEMMERCIPEDDGVRMEHAEEDDGEPIFLAHLFFAPDTAELNQRELVGAIEQMQCHLLSREREREGDALQRSAWEFERSRIQEMLDELNRRILKKLGVVEFQSEEEEPEEFRQGHSVTSWIRGSELETAEDIIACWYLSDRFPRGLNFEQMTRIEQKLKEQMETMETEEAEYEEHDSLDLWRFRQDIKAEQLEQIQTMMRNFNLDYEE